MNNATLHIHAVSMLHICVCLLYFLVKRTVFSKIQAQTILSQNICEGCCNSLNCFIFIFVEVHADTQEHVGG